MMQRHKTSSDEYPKQPLSLATLALAGFTHPQPRRWCSAAEALTRRVSRRWGWALWGTGLVVRGAQHGQGVGLAVAVQVLLRIRARDRRGMKGAVPTHQGFQCQRVVLVAGSKERGRRSLYVHQEVTYEELQLQPLNRVYRHVFYFTEY